MNKPKKILLVEDDPEIRAMIVAFLSPEDHEVIESHDVPDAIEKLSNGPPFELAILDFWLGRKHAVSIVDTIASLGYDIPVIMISGGNRVMDLETTEAISDISGASVFLQKPFRKARLLEAVTSALKR